MAKQILIGITERELSKICGKELTYQDVENGWKGFVTDVPQYKLDT